MPWFMKRKHHLRNTHQSPYIACEQCCQTCTLADLCQGERARVLSIEAGCGCINRLMAMGLIPDKLIQVEQIVGGGLSITIGDTRLGLGRGMAEKIKVEKLSLVAS